MKPRIVTITPQMAAQWLDANTRNRRISVMHVQALMREMKAGRWKVNGDMIRRCENGDLLDGQHRLTAGVRSGVTFKSWVMDGVPEDVFPTIDIGKHRSAADTLSSLGERNARDLAATLILIDRYMTGRALVKIDYSNAEMEGLLLKYPDANESIVSTANRTPLLLPSVMNCCHYLFSKKDAVMTAEFLEKICKGIGLEDGDPWYVLREKLMANHMSKAKMPKEHMWALCIKAWNFAREGKRIAVLRLSIENGKLTQFPVVQ
jgi:hypothetical protein